MKRTLPAFLLLSTTSLMLASCNTNGASNTTDEHVATDSIYPPVEQNDANTNYAPAFEGQTRAPGVKTQTAYEHRVVTDQLTSPWGITVLPDGRLLIAENAGDMRIVTADGELSDPISGIPEVDDRGQGGLLGLTLDPDFASNRMVYWVFSEPVAGGNHTAVAKGRLADDEKSIENAQVIYQALPTYDGRQHYGGRIIFDQDGHLFVGTGERSDLETRPQSQDLNSALGKIVRITKEGQPAPGNPFAGDADARPEIYSYGNRNVQGLALHPETGDLWSTEFGPRGGDELNLIEAGNNYGWPTITYGLEYSGAEIGDPPIQQHEGMEQPVYYWDPVLSPSGLIFYTSDAIPEWKNNLFSGGLSSTHIARIVIEGDRVVGEERLLDKEGQRFRDVAQGNDGELFAVTDGGRLYCVHKKED